MLARLLKARYRVALVSSCVNKQRRSSEVSAAVVVSLPREARLIRKPFIVPISIFHIFKETSQGHRSLKDTVENLMKSAIEK